MAGIDPTLPISKILMARPFEVLLAFLTTIVGLGLLLADPAQMGGFHGMPEILITLWVILMVAGGPLTIAGLLWRGNIVLGAALERAGLYLIASVYFTRAIANVVIVGSFSVGFWIAIPLYALIAVACLIRAYEVNQNIEMIQRLNSHEGS